MAIIKTLNVCINVHFHIEKKAENSNFIYSFL